MTREQLQTAADNLETAAETAGGDAGDRLQDLAGQLETLATRDRGPDHGRLARTQSALGEVGEDVGSDVASAIDDADDAINAYRETIEGV